MKIDKFITVKVFLLFNILLVLSCSKGDDINSNFPLLKSKKSVTLDPSFDTTYSYDSNDNLIVVWNPSGRLHANFEYDKKNRVIKFDRLSDDLQEAERFYYDDDKYR